MAKAIKLKLFHSYSYNFTINKLLQMNNLSHLGLKILGHSINTLKSVFNFNYKKLFSNVFKYSLYVSGVFTDFFLTAVLGIPIILFKMIKSTKVQNKDSPLVVLIHGSGVRSWQWKAAEFYLWSKNIDHMTVDYDSQKPIRYSTITVKYLIKKENVDNKQIITIGHSQGGIISRMLYNDPEINVIKNFSLHAPQTGAEITTVRNDLYELVGVKHWLKQSAYDMQKESKYVRNYMQKVKDVDSFVANGLIDFVEGESALWRSLPSRRFTSWFGHYYPAVNPLLWFGFIIPNIK